MHFGGTNNIFVDSNLLCPISVVNPQNKTTPTYLFILDFSFSVDKKNNIGALKMRNNFWVILKMWIFSTIGLFSIAPHKVIALQTFWLHIFYRILFNIYVIALNYCNSNSCRFLLLLTAIAKSNRLKKSNNYCYPNCWKSDNLKNSN